MEGSFIKSYLLNHTPLPADQHDLLIDGIFCVDANQTKKNMNSKTTPLQSGQSPHGSSLTRRHRALLGKLNHLMCAIIAAIGLAFGTGSPPDNPPQALAGQEQIVVPDTSPPGVIAFGYWNTIDGKSITAFKLYNEYDHGEYMIANSAPTLNVHYNYADFGDLSTYAFNSDSNSANLGDNDHAGDSGLRAAG